MVPRLDMALNNQPIHAIPDTKGSRSSTTNNRGQNTNPSERRDTNSGDS